ncbi:hypothetical protein TNCV_2994001 [Trichonephila clavipes]|nr:hypothetical protein TNCV_2994001 [Trichonephila clavipes]
MSTCRDKDTPFILHTIWRAINRPPDGEQIQRQNGDQTCQPIVSKHQLSGIEMRGAICRCVTLANRSFVRVFEPGYTSGTKGDEHSRLVKDGVPESVEQRLE